MQRGEIYLADLNAKGEHNIGKIRPVVVFQNDFLNRAVNEHIYADVTIIPLSTKLLGGDYRLKIAARDGLERDSEVVCNAVCTIHAEALRREEGVLTTLSKEETMHIERILAELFGCTQR
jgi:mRNA interferase MazF